MERTVFRYKITLNSIGDILEFTKAAVACSGEVLIVNGHHRLSAKSFLSVAMARISWDSITVEADFDCYFDFERFIQK